MNLINVKFKKIDERAIIPTIAYDNDAGMDFYSLDDVTLEPNSRSSFRTGLVWEPQFNLQSPFEIRDYYKIYLKIQSRSGLSVKQGIEIGAGTIDQEYRGEIIILLYNHTEQFIPVKAGSKIAQGIVYTIPIISISESIDVSETHRGERGFGSSNV